MRTTIRMYTDSQSPFEVISIRPMTAERRLRIDISLAREGFDRKCISNIALIASHDYLADALNKAMGLSRTSPSTENHPFTSSCSSMEI
jgi:hypothetical protein